MSRPAGTAAGIPRTAGSRGPRVPARAEPESFRSAGVSVGSSITDRSSRKLVEVGDGRDRRVHALVPRTHLRAAFMLIFRVRDASQ